MKNEDMGIIFDFTWIFKFYKNVTETTNNTKKSILAVVATDTSVLL